eukprot:CAMPEP_0201285964 /NCGR_PEP_ID=MMETSP1317-20130820/114086_1 /ASSEMBLY_ACC=CAM_ASM_000770 /TAXON_ID=187299 /ORGANISM="Undescribed Undescribed, Strain Undescribed" /LENGTH=88 /DNA_ID=CAMNT_0047612263 /DNA_START=840 /DNA_END=1106 /DNA_ORIENTATION=-
MLATLYSWDLIIPAYALPAGSTTIFGAKVTSLNAEYNEEIVLPITVYVPYEDLEADIIGGANVESSFYLDLVLNAKKSNDPNGNPLIY